MDDLQPLTVAARMADTPRQNLQRWIKEKRLKVKPGIVDNRPVKLVSVLAVKSLAAKVPLPGRPRKTKSK